jgi:hypothetical protein
MKERKKLLRPRRNKVMKNVTMEGEGEGAGHTMNHYIHGIVVPLLPFD